MTTTDLTQPKMTLSAEEVEHLTCETALMYLEAEAVQMPYEINLHVKAELARLLKSADAAVIMRCLAEDAAARALDAHEIILQGRDQVRRSKDGGEPLDEDEYEKILDERRQNIMERGRARREETVFQHTADALLDIEEDYSSFTSPHSEDYRD